MGTVDCRADHEERDDELVEAEGEGQARGAQRARARSAAASPAGTPSTTLRPGRRRPPPMRRRAGRARRSRSTGSTAGRTRGARSRRVTSESLNSTTWSLTRLKKTRSDSPMNRPGSVSGRKNSSASGPRQRRGGPAEAVGGERPEHERDRRGRGRDDQAVPSRLRNSGEPNTSRYHRSEKPWNGKESPAVSWNENSTTTISGTNRNTSAAIVIVAGDRTALRPLHQFTNLMSRSPASRRTRADSTKHARKATSIRNDVAAASGQLPERDEVRLDLHPQRRPRRAAQELRRDVVGRRQDEDEQERARGRRGHQRQDHARATSTGAFAPRSCAASMIPEPSGPMAA